MLDAVSAFVRGAVERYRGNVDYWICAGRVNTAEVLSLSEQERLRLAARIVELVRSLDPDTPLLVSFDQPWAEYMRQARVGFPSVALRRRSDPGGGRTVGLDDGDERRLLSRRNAASPSVGTRSPPGDMERVWVAAVVVAFGAPAPNTRTPWHTIRAPCPRGIGTAATQRAWMARFVLLSLAKLTVQGVLWNQLRDSEPHDFPHGGLFDDRRRAKPALRSLTSIRQIHLK